MRNLTIRKRLEALKRRFKRVSPKRFFYNDKRELRQIYARIHTWFLISDKDRGYSIFPFDIQRKKEFTVKEWGILFKKPYGGYESIYSVFTQAVLPAINARSGAEWRFIALIGWAGNKNNDLSKTKNTSRNRRGNKTAKKRNANAHRRNRRR